MTKFSDKYVVDTYKNTGELEVLTQCLQITHDGDLVSKSDRDIWHLKGFISRINGFNIITSFGVEHLEKTA